MRPIVITLFAVSFAVAALHRSPAQSALPPAVELQFRQREVELADQRSCVGRYRETQMRLDLALQTIVFHASNFDRSQVSQYEQTRKTVQSATAAITGPGIRTNPLCAFGAITALDRIDSVLASHGFPATQEALDRWLAARSAEVLETQAWQLD